jgi:hypothetical protein
MEEKADNTGGRLQAATNRLNKILKDGSGGIIIDCARWN